MMFDLPPADPALEVSIASQGMSKGLSQTEGPQLLSKASVQIGKLQVGAQWKNVTSPAAEGEAAAFISANVSLAGFQLGGSGGYKFQTGVHGNPDSGAFELTGNASRKVGPLGTRLSLIYSPNDLGTTGTSLYAEGGLSLDLDASTRISASLGRRERGGSADYTAFNAGISHVLLKNVALDLRYHDTDGGGLGEPYRGRVVAMVRMSF